MCIFEQYSGFVVFCQVKKAGFGDDLPAFLGVSERFFGIFWKIFNWCVKAGRKRYITCLRLVCNFGVFLGVFG
jgi:hypothetical protein